MADPSKVLAEALDLPVRERLRIANASLRSVDPEEDEDAAEAWVAEIDRRSASVEDRTAQLIDAADGFAEAIERAEWLIAEMPRAWPQWPGARHGCTATSSPVSCSRSPTRSW